MWVRVTKESIAPTKEKLKRKKYSKNNNCKKKKIKYKSRKTREEIILVIKTKEKTGINVGADVAKQHKQHISVAKPIQRRITKKSYQLRAI